MILDVMAKAGQNKTYHKIVYGQGRMTSLTRVNLGDAERWTVDQIRGVAMGIANAVIDQQASIQNYPEEVRVDGAVNKPVSKMTSRIDVQFGAVDARPMMNQLESIVSGSPGIGAIGWRWVVVGDKSGSVRKDITGGGPVLLGYNARLLLVPTGPLAHQTALRNQMEIYGYEFQGTRLVPKGGRGAGRQAKKLPGPVGRASRNARRAGAPFFTVSAKVSTRYLHGGKYGWQANNSIFNPSKKAFYAGSYFFSVRRNRRGFGTFQRITK